MLFDFNEPLTYYKSNSRSCILLLYYFLLYTKYENWLRWTVSWHVIVCDAPILSTRSFNYISLISWCNKDSFVPFFETYARSSFSHFFTLFGNDLVVNAHNLTLAWKSRHAPFFDCLSIDTFDVQKNIFVCICNRIPFCPVCGHELRSNAKIS